MSQKVSQTFIPRFYRQKVENQNTGSGKIMLWLYDGKIAILVLELFYLCQFHPSMFFQPNLVLQLKFIVQLNPFRNAPPITIFPAQNHHPIKGNPGITKQGPKLEPKKLKRREKQNFDQIGIENRDRQKFSPGPSLVSSKILKKFVQVVYLPSIKQGLKNLKCLLSKSSLSSVRIPRKSW